MLHISISVFEINSWNVEPRYLIAKASSIIQEEQILITAILINLS